MWTRTIVWFSMVWLWSIALPAVALPLSPGDRLKVTIPDGDDFTGEYEVNGDGTIELPYLGRLAVEGLESEQVAESVRVALVQGGYFQPTFLKVAVQTLDYSPIQVFVEGATFQPGRVLINQRPATLQASGLQTVSQIPGDSALERSVSTALRAAGGITPVADLHHILILRGEQEQVVDLSGLFTGQPVEDRFLVAGDRVIVPSIHFQNDLVRPSQITPPGIRIFVSNLTIPADSNATSANSGGAKDFPYGSRFSQAAIAMNCVGGAHPTNAHRRAMLVRTSRLTGETTVLEKPVETLERESRNDVDNPFLMPDDAIACYDSDVTNTRDVFRTIGDILSPFGLLLNLFTGK